jgi:hypothetical protein
MEEEQLTIADFPQDVVDFLSSYEGFEFAQKFVEGFKLDKEKVSSVIRLVEDVVIRYVALEDLPKEIVSRFGLSQDVANAAAVEIASVRLLPLEGVIGDVSGAIRDWGGDIAGIRAQTQFVMPAMTAQDFAKSFLAEHAAVMPDPHLQNRLEQAITTYLKREKSGKETLELLVREVKIGGLAMQKEEASGILLEIERLILDLQLVFAPELAELPKKKVVDVAPPVKKVEKVKEVNKVDKIKKVSEIKEVKKVKKVEKVEKVVKEKKPELAPIPKPSVPKKKKIELAPEPKMPKNKIEKVNPAELDQASPGEVNKAAKVKRAISPLQDVFSEEDEKEIAKHSVKSLAMSAGTKPLIDIEEAKARILDAVSIAFDDVEKKKRFGKLIEMRLRDIRDAYETRNQLERSIEQGGLGLSGNELADISHAIEEIVGDYHHDVAKKTKKEKTARQAQLKKERAARAKKKQDEQGAAHAKRYEQIAGKGVAKQKAQLGQKEVQVNTDQLKKAAVAGAGAPVRPLYSDKTLHGQGKPQMQDVRFSRKLSGPVEELRSLSLKDFRRLSSSPQEAVKKIQGKIDLLESDGFEKKIAGIKAWRESPINKLYVLISQDAFLSGKPVAQILEEKEAAGETVLTTNDMKAIMGLNADLRF